MIKRDSIEILSLMTGLMFFFGLNFLTGANGALQYWKGAGFLQAAETDSSKSVSSSGSVSRTTEEIVCESSVKSVALFKNGLAAVREEIEVPRKGRYILKNAPSPVYGTFFIESDAEIVASSSLREMEVSLTEMDNFALDDLVGKKVYVRLHNGSTLEGMLLTNRKKSSPENFVPVLRGDSSLFSGNYAYGDGGSGLILKKSSGELVFIPNRSEIVEIGTVTGEKLSHVRRKVPTLVLEVKGAPDCQEAIKIGISYLVHGLTWTPSCRLDLKEKESVQVELSALLINQWRDLANVEFFVLSGFPKIPFANVPSLLDPEVSLRAFFSALGQSENRFANGTTAQVVMMNQARTSDRTDDSFGGITDMKEMSSSEGVMTDIHFQNLGLLTLGKGERLQMTVDRKKTDLKKRIVWKIADNRDRDGRILWGDELARQEGNYGQTQSGFNNEANSFREPIDVLLFKNPFDFPMTTSPVFISQNGRFLGQGTNYWTNSGETASVRVNKALSIRVSSKEFERQLNKNGNGVLNEEKGNSDGKKQENSVDAGIQIQQKKNSAPVAQLGNSVAVPSGVAFLSEAQGNTSIKTRRDVSDFFGKDSTVVINGRTYRRAIIDAEIEIKNQRKEKVFMTIYRKFSGDPLFGDKVEGAAETHLVNLADQLNGVNKRYELTLEISLEANESKTLRFDYSVLIGI